MRKMMAIGFLVAAWGLFVGQKAYACETDAECVSDPDYGEGWVCYDGGCCWPNFECDGTTCGFNGCGNEYCECAEGSECDLCTNTCCTPVKKCKDESGDMSGDDESNMNLEVIECGEHNNGCNQPIDCGDCQGALEECVEGYCVCRNGQEKCGGTCCPDGQVCHSGSCCTPSTVCAPNACGTMSNGCGGIKTCPQCTDGRVCHNNQCCDTLESLEFECGKHINNCGQELDFGSCPANATCVNGYCQCVQGSTSCSGVCCAPGDVCRDGNGPCCNPNECEEGQCGTFADNGCGFPLNCSVCPDGQTCEGNQCRDLLTCANYPGQCGVEFSDGYDGTFSCACEEGQCCNAGFCKTQKTSCSSYDCGLIDNNCNGSIDCGGCPAGHECRNHTCECVPSWSCGGRCGTVRDNCGGTHYCGGCPPNFRCVGGFCERKSSGGGFF